MILAELRSDQADFRDRPTTVAVLPLGAVEQHSRHLPLGTDALIAEAVARMLEREHPDQVVLLPTISVGASDHHLSMPGSASVGSSVIAEAAARQCLSIAKSSGISTFLLLNGHGGNQPATRIALETIHAQNAEIRGFAADYWALMFEILDAQGIEHPTSMGHADHIETSILLATRPELVVMDRAVADAYVDDTPSFVATTSGIPERTAHGGVGDPRHASAEDGTTYLNAAVSGAAALVSRLFG